MEEKEKLLLSDAIKTAINQHKEIQKLKRRLSISICAIICLLVLLGILLSRVLM